MSAPTTPADQPERPPFARHGAVIRVGLISDTHGLLRPEAKAFLSGCNYIVHGGDIGNAAILEELSSLAPVTAVRGNNDTGPWAEQLHETELLKVEEVYIYTIHDIAQLDIDPLSAGVRIVVSGHSHKPLVVERQGVLYVNPGSAGPRRFKLPVSVAEVLVSGALVTARTIELTVHKR